MDLRTDRHARRAAVALLAVAALAVAGAACSSDDDDPTTTETSAAPDATADGSTTSEPEPTDTTAATASVALRLDGVGPADVGTPADDAVAALTGVLGAPTELLPWTQPACEVAGPDGEGARGAVWDGLIVSFRGAAEADAALAGWTYRGGPVGTAGPLALDTGVGVGDPGDALATAYGPDATFVAADVFDPHWEVARGGHQLWAIVDADDPTAAIARMDLDPIVCE